MHQFAPTLTLLQFAYSFYSPLHPFTVKSHCSSHWYRVIRLVAPGQQSGRGLGLTRPVIRVQLNPLCLCSIAPVMGCYRSRSPWDFITHTKIDKPDTLNGREGLALEVQAISLLSGSMPQVSVQWGTQVRGGAQQRKWHISCLPDSAPATGDI